jgi:hypothetical protein
VNALVLAGAFLVLAQLVGIYALVTRQADFIFAIVVGVLLLIAVIVGGVHIYHRLH